jgi:hypothetical protein
MGETPGRGAAIGQGLALATEQMAADWRAAHLRRRRVELLDRAIRALDGLIDDLERLNLGRKRRVPPSWQARLDLVARTLPAGFDPDLKVGVSPMRLLNEAYSLQERLFNLKCGRELGAVREAEAPDVLQGAQEMAGAEAVGDLIAQGATA